MKKIFEWIMEQMNEYSEEMHDWNDESFEVVEFDNIENIINEAEAKWEAECCAWEHKRYHANCLCKCNDNHIFLDYDLVSSFGVCPYCGKPIKISEVE